jgi:hypothetical protein
MNGFLAFAVSFGAMLTLMALMAVWLFRTARAPLWQAMPVMALVVAAACATPYQVAAMMGYPIWTPFSSLPKQAELIAFVPHDDDKRVDLLLREGHDAPRLYETAMDDNMKKLLREADEKLKLGERVGVIKRKGPKREGVTDIETPEAPYVLSNDAFALPSKDSPH